MAGELWPAVNPDRVTAIIGSGGKTALMSALAAVCPGPAVMTTTTKIYPPPPAESPVVVLEHEAGPGFRGELARGLAGHGRVMAARAMRGDGKLEGFSGRAVCRLAAEFTDAFFLSRPTARPAGRSRPPGPASRW
ncbi:MAG: hypothetical protein KKC37_01895, partial [Proteobacteria bacterium]|nr:hypothetical protein [Pseudomonadota bacterium]